MGLRSIKHICLLFSFFFIVCQGILSFYFAFKLDPVINKPTSCLFLSKCLANFSMKLFQAKHLRSTLFMFFHISTPVIFFWPYLSTDLGGYKTPHLTLLTCYEYVMSNLLSDRKCNLKFNI